MPPRQQHRGLYTELVAECQRCLDELSQSQQLTLGKLPKLASQLVNRLAVCEPELTRLSTVEDRGFSLAGHAVNVAILAVQVGMELELKTPQLLDLAIGALLHDIGMVKISHLFPSPTHFSPEQRSELFHHPLWGQDLSRRCPDLPRLTSDIIVQEHERYDGSGYPNHLSGESIHEYAQLVGLLDVYEALSHDRPHRRRLLFSEAMRTIVRHHRPAFRYELLRAFLQAVPFYPVDSWVRLSTGEVARIVATERRVPLSPIVSVMVDVEGRLRPSPETFDLAKEPRLTIMSAAPEPMLRA